MNTQSYWCFLFAGLLLLSSCKQETTELLWKQIDLPTNERLEAVFLQNDSIIYTIGGTGYKNGISVSSYDAGMSWQVDTISGVTGYDIFAGADGRVIAGGLFGIRRKANRYEPWYVQGLSLDFDIPPVNAIARLENGNTILGGGVSFQNGLLMELNNQYLPQGLELIDNEINDITYITPQNAIAVGYGAVFQSQNGGRSWTQLPVYQDNFTSVHFPTETTGYIVGFSGSILKTTDGGENWKTLRDGDKLTVSDQPFRSVFFQNEFEGYIVGDDGLLWVTTNGADDWKAVTDLPDEDFYDIKILNNNAYVVGDNGVFLVMEL